jgi:hypothetical protein
MLFAAMACLVSKTPAVKVGLAFGASSASAACARVVSVLTAVETVPTAVETVPTAVETVPTAVVSVASAACARVVSLATSAASASVPASAGSV